MPEFWGKDSPYHPGTDFLGTPKDHLDVSGVASYDAKIPCSLLCSTCSNLLVLQHASYSCALCDFMVTDTLYVRVQRVKHRPVSPHVFEEGGTKFHYNMPINAITSIMNRATGVALTVGELTEAALLQKQTYTAAWTGKRRQMTSVKSLTFAGGSPLLLLA